MGTLDRPTGGDPPDAPKEVAPRPTEPVRDESTWWLNTDRQPSTHLQAAQGEAWGRTPFHRMSPENLKIPELADDAASKVAAAIKGPSHWRPGDPVPVREFGVLAKDWDKQPGVETPDYRNPDAKDTLKFEPGDKVIVGKQGSEDNPRRYVSIGEGVHLVDEDEALEPRLPSGEDTLDLEDESRSKRDKVADVAAKSENIEDFEDVAKEVSRLVSEWLEPPSPSGSYTGTPDRPVINAQQPQGIDGAIAIVPVVLWLVAHYGIRSGLNRFNEWKQSRGS